ncbi:MAG: energy transducer TonB [Bacteroidota bacterium]
MRFILLLSAFFFQLTLLTGQADSIPANYDTTIYKVADELPRFPTPCEQLDTTIVFKNRCSEQALLRYITSRSIYPQEARENGISGTPVITFIVEPNGLINAPRILRDPGGNLGLAALQAVLNMQQQVRWRPAIIDGKPVRFQFNLPVRFKLEDPKPYVIVDRDTVYTQFDKKLDYQGGSEALQQHFKDNLKYPEAWQDSCLVGQMEVRVLVQPDNIVRILDITDYNNLGFDFWYEAIHTSTNTYGQWIPAEFEGRKVAAAFDLSMSFLPEAAGCKTVLENYEKAAAAINEGSALATEKNYNEAIEKMSEAVALFPLDGQFRIIRGQTLMDANRLGEACQDLALARRIALVNWFDSVLPLLCKPQPTE